MTYETKVNLENKTKAELILYINEAKYIIQKQDTEINKLNNVIDRMAKYMASGNKYIYATPEMIKEDFMKEDK